VYRVVAFILLLACGIVHAQGVPTPAVVPKPGDVLPQVTIVDFKIFNQSLPVDSLLKLKRIELPNDRNTFSISFTLSGTLQPDTFTYFYKLDGAEKDWMQTSKPSTIS
jgi:hypothetical protein